MRTLLLLLLLPLQMFSQDLTGVWTGYLQSEGNNLIYEVAISSNRQNLNGYALTIFTFNGVENIGIKSIKLKYKNEKIIIEDNELVYDNYTTPPKKVKLLGNLILHRSDSVMMLDGTFFTRSLDFRSQDKDPFTGTIHLQKQNLQSTSKLLAKLDELNLLNTLSFITPKPKPQQETSVADIEIRQAMQPGEKQVFASSAHIVTPVPIFKPFLKDAKPAVIVDIEPQRPSPQEEKQNYIAATKKYPDKKLIAPLDIKQKNIVNTSAAVAVAKANQEPVAAAELQKRQTEVIQNVDFRTDSLVLTLYDNGTIDGDTVSVVLNGKVILARVGLTANAIRTTIHITPALGDSLQLVMYAENLGSIPPNTGLLIIQDGEVRNEIRFAGDMQKSSAIIFKRKR